MPIFRPLFLVATTLAASGLSSPALAGTDTAEVAVSAEVITGCTISASPMRFGSLFGVTGAVRTTAAINLRCTPNTDFGVEMDYGLHRQGNVRRLRNPVGNRFLRYRIYSDAGYSRQWDERPRRQVNGNSGSSGLVSLTAYGEITNVTNLSASGTYSDTVVVTVEF